MRISQATTGEVVSVQTAIILSGKMNRANGLLFK